MSPVVTVDIRGIPRPFGASYDIGAYESPGGPPIGDPTLPPPPTPTGDTVANFVPKGSLVIAGFGDFPMRFYSPSGVRLSAPISAPIGDASGVQSLVVFSTGGYFDDRYIFNSQFNRVVSDVFIGSYGLSADSIGNIYQMVKLLGDDWVVKRINYAGAETGSWVVDNGITPLRMHVGVNAAGTIAYINRTDSVIAHDLVGDTSLGTFVTETGSRILQNVGHPIYVLPNGEVLIGWGSTAPSNFVKRYSAAGATLAAYTINKGNRVGEVFSGIDPTISFWVNYGDLTSPYGSSIVEIRISDGAILHRFSPPNDGFDYESWAIVTIDIGTPVSSPPPGSGTNLPTPSSVVPQIKCTPITIRSSPARNAGCNNGGTGWTPSYSGVSGTVPVGANPIDGETLTGKQAVNMWVELEHRVYF